MSPHEMWRRCAADLPLGMFFASSQTHMVRVRSEGRCRALIRECWHVIIVTVLVRSVGRHVARVGTRAKEGFFQRLRRCKSPHPPPCLARVVALSRSRRMTCRCRLCLIDLAEHGNNCSEVLLHGGRRDEEQDYRRRVGSRLLVLLGGLGRRRSLGVVGHEPLEQGPSPLLVREGQRHVAIELRRVTLCVVACRASVFPQPREQVVPVAGMRVVGRSDIRE